MRHAIGGVAVGVLIGFATTRTNEISMEAIWRACSIGIFGGIAAWGLM